jgi:hypothetical protein
VDRFWFLEMTPLMYSMGPFAIDEEGCGYSNSRPREKPRKKGGWEEVFS